jgi:hypothetical protein
MEIYATTQRPSRVTYFRHPSITAMNPAMIGGIETSSSVLDRESWSLSGVVRDCGDFGDLTCARSIE